MQRWSVQIRGAAVLLLAAGVLSPGSLSGQTASPTIAANQVRARKILDQTIMALGGQKWFNARAIRTTGTTAGFFHGEPTGAIAQTTEITAFPTDVLPFRRRLDLAKGQIVHIYVGRQGWEITYKGKKPLLAKKLADTLRWRDHSLRTALRQWYSRPGTMLVYDGQALYGPRLVDKVSLFSRENDKVALELDRTTHLPVRLSFRWRDPQFHDMNTDAVEYDNYRVVEGIATPLTTTRTHNGETVYQRFLRNVRYNPGLPADLFNPDRAAAHLK